MAKWWKFGFGFGKGKGKEEGPASEPTPAPAPRPEPTPAPAGEAPKKRGGLFGRLFGRGKKKEAPAPEEAPAEEAPAEAEEAPAEEAAEEAEAPPAAPPEPERVYPPFLHVSADGDWVISDTEWSGTMSGTLHGSDVKTFIDAMEAEGGPDYHTAIPLIADAYGIPGGLLDIRRSTIHSVDY